MTLPDERKRTGVRKRVTLKEIAASANVSVGAASFALTGRPGVSSATRERILSVAHELGWVPNPAARALSASRANAIGFAMVRPPGVRSIDTYFVQLMSGLESGASAAGLGLVLRLADHLDDLANIYRDWWAAGSVDGVIMTDLQHDDPRLLTVAELSIPAVAIGGSPDMSNVSTVSGDAFETTQRIVSYLWAHGHRHIARVGGPARLLHTEARDKAFVEVLNDLGEAAADHPILHANYSAGEGISAARDLLTRRKRPSAIIFDNDVMAAGGLQVTRELELDVPGEVSFLTWDDSDLCTIVEPAISAVMQEPVLQAQTAVRLLEDMLDGGNVNHIIFPAGKFAVRASSGPAPRL